MWDWWGHMNGWWWLAVPMMVAFWTFVIWAVVTLVRGGCRSRSSAEDILAERFARGDLDEAEYRRRRDLVRSR